jgi:two-component system chemotaxis sensor kinase CheA
MPTTQLDQDALLRLVDDLAIKLVLGGDDWRAPLDSFAGTALAAQAAALRNSLGALDPESPEFARVAQDALTALRDTVSEGAAPPKAAAPVSIAQDPELVADFIMESREHIQSIEQNVLLLEQDATLADPIHAMFRAFHTIKGIAGFLEFQEIRLVSHETETLLDLARNGVLRLGSERMDLILAAADYLGREISRIESGGSHAASPDALVQRLSAAAQLSDSPLDALSGAIVEAGAGPAPEPAIDPEPEQPRADGSPKKKSSAIASIKVDTNKLDFLIDMVGEMVIAQSLVRHSPELAGVQTAALQRNVAQLSRITGEVQKTAMSMRMVPIGLIFQKMARLVRDLCKKSGKQAEFVTEGEDTELDRNIVEELADPLMHMIRNAVDHGIESPEDRVAAGKSPSARVTLRASHKGGHILIEIADDGRGMSRDAILKKAKSKGLVKEGVQLSDYEVYNLIFEPGFSTAEKVTDISGRGVGMDVVKRHIQKLRGQTEIRTEIGRGTTFQMKLPLTLAIIDGLIVGVGAERYIVPIFAVKQILRPEPGMVSTIENRREIALIRKRVLPVVRLYRKFQVKPRTEDPLESLLIITESQGAEYCLMVDALLGKQEVVIKSLGESLKAVPGLAGGAILGDGRVGLILDMNAIQSIRVN